MFIWSTYYTLSLYIYRNLFAMNRVDAVVGYYWKQASLNLTSRMQHMVTNFGIKRAWVSADGFYFREQASQNIQLTLCLYIFFLYHGCFLCEAYINSTFLCTFPVSALWCYFMCWQVITLPSKLAMLVYVVGLLKWSDGLFIFWTYHTPHMISFFLCSRILGTLICIWNNGRRYVLYLLLYYSTYCYFTFL